MTKLLVDEATDRVTGCGIVDPSAGDLISEAALAVRLGASASDIGLTVHPHPTLSETVAMAAEASKEPSRISICRRGVSAQPCQVPVPSRAPIGGRG
jgi:hypothetical protein